MKDHVHHAARFCGCTLQWTVSKPNGLQNLEKNSAQFLLPVEKLQCNREYALFFPTHGSVSPIFGPEEHLDRPHASVAVKGLPEWGMFVQLVRSSEVSLAEQGSNRYIYSLPCGRRA